MATIELKTWLPDVETVEVSFPLYIHQDDTDHSECPVRRDERWIRVLEDGSSMTILARDDDDGRPDESVTHWSAWTERKHVFRLYSDWKTSDRDQQLGLGDAASNAHDFHAAYRTMIGWILDNGNIES